MAVTYLSTIAGNYLVLCLSSDTKPSASTNAILFETDTAKKFKESAGSWVEVSGGAAEDPDKSPTTSKTIATGKTVVQGRVYQITGSLNLTIQGTGTLTII